MTKTCSKCKTSAPVAQFSVARNTVDGLQRWCKLCQKEHARRRIDDPVVREKWIAMRREAYQRDAEAIKAKARDYRRDRPERAALASRKWLLKSKYNLTLEQFEALVASQNGACAICVKPTEKLHVDHDHESGVVRALLCTPCNTALGAFEDDPDRLRRAAEYVERFRRA